MDQSELWIGDSVKLKSSGKIGKYIGQNPIGKARVSYGDKVLLVRYSNLEIVEEKDILDASPDLTELIQDDKSPRPTWDSNSIDLHIETLAPHLLTERAELILQYQLKNAKWFVEDVVSRRIHSAVIIHGKGEGVLKSEVYHLLKDFENVYLKNEINNGGAVEIYFQY